MVVTCAAENTRAQAASLARGGPRDLLTCERVRRRVRGRRDAPRPPAPYGCAAQQHPGVGSVAGCLRAPGCAASCTSCPAAIQLMTVMGRGATGAQAPVRQRDLHVVDLDAAGRAGMAARACQCVGRPGAGASGPTVAPRADWRRRWHRPRALALPGPAGAESRPSASVTYGQPPASCHYPHAPSDLHQQTLDANSAFFSANAIHRPWGARVYKGQN